MGSGVEFRRLLLNLWERAPSFIGFSPAAIPFRPLMEGCMAIRLIYACLRRLMSS